MHFLRALRGKGNWGAKFHLEEKIKQLRRLKAINNNKGLI